MKAVSLCFIGRIESSRNLQYLNFDFCAHRVKLLIRRFAITAQKIKTKFPGGITPTDQRPERPPFCCRSQDAALGGIVLQRQPWLKLGNP